MTTVTIVEQRNAVTVEEGVLHVTPVEQETAVTVSLGGVTDHGALSGLADDDHTQYLLKAGGTMTGALTLAGAPSADLHAATKLYVDTEVAGAGGGASDVGDLTTTGLTAANMLRVAAAGGLEERTPAQVLGDIGAVNKAGDTMAGALSIPGAGFQSERFGANTVAAGVNSVAIGESASAAGQESIVIGRGATDNANRSGVTIGYLASGNGAYGITIGYQAVGAASTVAIGQAAAATGGGSVAVGPNASAAYSGAIAIGSGIVMGNYGIAIGVGTVAHGRAVALGYDAETTAVYGIAIGYGARAAQSEAAFGSDGAPINAVKPYTKTALTNAVQDVYIANHRTAGTPAAGLGVGHLFQLESSTTESQNAARIAAVWTETTHATRKADLVLSAFDTAEREGLRIRATGSAALLITDLPTSDPGVTGALWSDSGTVKVSSG